jgi:predicted ATPase
MLRYLRHLRHYAKNRLHHGRENLEASKLHPRRVVTIAGEARLQSSSGFSSPRSQKARCDAYRSCAITVFRKGSSVCSSSFSV